MKKTFIIVGKIMTRVTEDLWGVLTAERSHKEEYVFYRFVREDETEEEEAEVSGRIVGYR